MKKKILILSLLSFILFPFLLVMIVAGTLGGSTSSRLSNVDGITYVEHWSTDNAYTHNLLAHRYGITTKQLDGFLDTLGVSYDKSRINGEMLLKWSQSSGLDVRAIVAIAMMESSLGTAGIATRKGANMFGYGAFDSNPNNATNYNDETAIVTLTKITIIQNKNETFKIQDDKALKNSKGILNPSTDGGVYFTDTSGSGKRRAEIMEKLDKFIDEHGGTPKPPQSTASRPRDGGGITSAGVPSGYSLTKVIDTSHYTSATYPWGQCTWFVYNRAREVGISFDPYMGNGGDWQYKIGYQTTHTPTEYSAISFSPGQAGSDLTYGHVVFVEQVKSDGTVLISESNAQGLGVITFRIFDKETAKQFTYVIGK